ncbi:MAG TPA: Na+/H+ antiporter NhaC [Bacteroidales bacterium]|nr:Na+/H+ antiporter NhaC [Bacteroidales bacterium]
MTRQKRKPGLLEASIPLIFLTILISFNVLIFGADSLEGSNQIVLIMSAAVAALVAFRIGFTWDEMLSGIVKSIGAATPAIIILFMIGALAGTWLLSGIIPSMIYYGLQILNPTIFLVVACVVCAIVSIATGTSWGTVATIGVALLGIGRALGLPDGLIGGAIISGAYLGDKFSPLSDTTNLSVGMAGSDLFTHVRYMVWTTLPTMIITLLIFAGIGIFRPYEGQYEDITPLLRAIDGTFHITPLLFIVPAVVIFLIVRKAPALPALFIGTVAGALFAIIFQPQIIRQVSGIDGQFHLASFIAVMKAMYTDISVISGHEMADNLLQTGGMSGMLNTVWLIFCAMIFGGVMEGSGLLQRITESIIKLAHNTGSLVASTVSTCVFLNLTASDQYLSIVIPGRMFAATYRKQRLKPHVLSRTLQDSATVTSALVPWNTCGATQAAVLGIPAFSFIPYAFFNILTPFVTIIVAYMNFKIERYPAENPDDNLDQGKA